MRSTYQVVALSLLLLLCLVGCMGNGQVSKATLSNVHIETQFGHPIILFNETVAADSTATVALESPNGTVITEQPSGIGGEANRISVTDPAAGEYTLNLIQNNQTIDTKTVTITAPQPRVTVATNWDAATLSPVIVNIDNEGDLSTNASVSIYEASSELYTTTSQTVTAGGPTTFLLDPTGGVYTVEESGPVTLRIVIETDTETIERSINHTVQPPAVNIHSVTPVWQTNNLQEVTYSVSNAGDLPADLNGNITVEGTEAVEINNVTVGANETKAVSSRESTDVDSDPLYRADTGSLKTHITVTYSDSTASASNTTTVTSTSAELRNVETMWTSTSGRDLGLSDVSFTLDTRDSAVGYDTIKIESGNQTVIEDAPNTGTILSHVESRRLHYVGGNTQIEAAPGTYELTISLLDSNELLVERTVSVTAEAS